MNKCLQYDSCKKKESCSILGECVFGHELMKSRIPQAVLSVHYGSKIQHTVNAFRKLKRGESWRGSEDAARGHMETIGL